MELPADLPRRLAEVIRRAAPLLGLEVAGDCSASELALSDGRLVPMQTFWREIEPHERVIFEAADSMLSEIAKRGPGRVWTRPGLELVHPIYNDGLLVGLDAKNRPHARLRAVYYHEADAFVPPPPPEVT